MGEKEALGTGDGGQAISPLPVQKLRYLDGIRAIATLGIIFAHVQTMLVLPFSGVIVAREYPLAVGLRMYTDLVGGLFATVAGFFAMLPIMLSKDQSIRGGIRAYLFRRGQRILIPYYIVIIASCLIIKLLENQPIGITIGSAGQVTPFTVITHLLLIHNLTGDNRYMINGPLWYVGLQWQLYIAFPLFFLPVWRRFGARCLLVITSLLGYGIVLFYTDPYRIFPWYIPLFTMGMIIAQVSILKVPRYIQWREKLPWGHIVFAILAIVTVLRFIDMQIAPGQIYDLIPDYRRLIFYDFFGMAFAGASILHCQQIETATETKRTSLIYGILSHPWLGRIGTISYSLILMHYPVLVAMRQTAQVLHLTSLATVIWMYLLSTFAVFIVGHLFFIGVQQRLPSSR